MAIYRFNIILSANYTPAAGAWYVVPFDTANVNEGGYFDTVNYRVTPPASSWMMAFLHLRSDAASNDQKKMSFFMDGAQEFPFQGMEQGYAYENRRVLHLLRLGSGVSYWDARVYLGSGTRTFITPGSCFHGIIYT